MAKSIAEMAKIEKEISFTPSSAASYLLLPNSNFLIGKYYISVYYFMGYNDLK